MASRKTVRGPIYFCCGFTLREDPMAKVGIKGITTMEVSHPCLLMKMGDTGSERERDS